MRLTRWSFSTTLLSAALVVATLVGCAAPTGDNASGWKADVFRADLEPGSCIDGSYDAEENVQRSLDFSATYFRVVDCSQTHAAQVLGRVGIPAAIEWASYGTAQGPSQAEADRWLEGVCNAYEVLVANSVDNAAKFGEPQVEPIYGLFVDSQLGYCVLYSSDEGGLTRVVDVNAMVAAAADIRDLGAAVPDTATGWLDGLGSTSTSVGLTDWFEVTPGSCVLDYAGPEEEGYAIVDCALDHAAQAVRWVELSPAWNGVFPGDDAANAYAANACAATQVELAANNDPSLDIVVEASDASEDYVFDDVFISICWARFADRGDITGSFLPAG